MILIIDSKKLGKLYVEYESYMLPYITIRKLADSTEYTGINGSTIGTVFSVVGNEEINYTIIKTYYDGTRNNSSCIACDVSIYFDYSTELYHINFVENTITPIDKEEKEENEYSTTSEEKTIRIGKVNYKVDDDDFTIYAYDDESCILVIDWVKHKLYEVDQSYFIPWTNDEPAEEDFLEDKFFRESSMMTYDYRQKLEDGYYFVSVKKEEDEDEE